MKSLVIGVGYLVLPKPQRTIWVRKQFESSGPAYIKLGQFISQRKDIFGADLSNALSGLKDRVKPVPWEFIEDDIPEGIFKYVDPVPIATASIAQVHRGVLNDGSEVALKIKKPNVENEFIYELNELRTLALVVPTLRGFVRDFEKSIRKELDFEREILNIKTFYDVYKYSSQVIVPRVYDKLSNNKLIVMQFVPSDSIQPKARTLIRIFINQLLFENVIHGDLHSGNIGNLVGAVVLYDFGNVIKTGPKYRRAMREFVMAVQSKDAEQTIEALSTMGVQIKNRESSLFFIRKFFDYIDTVDIKTFRLNPDEIQDKVPMILDETTTSILRSYSLLEGYCKRIDPKFSYEKIIQETLEILLLDSLI